MCKEVDLLEQSYDKLPDIPHFSSLLKMCDGKLFTYKTKSEGEFHKIFAETLQQQAANMGDLIPELTIYQFIDELKQHG